MAIGAISVWSLLRAVFGILQIFAHCSVSLGVDATAGLGSEQHFVLVDDVGLDGLGPAQIRHTCIPNAPISPSPAEPPDNLGVRHFCASELAALVPGTAAGQCELVSAFGHRSLVVAAAERSA